MLSPVQKKIRLTHQFKWRNVIIDEECHYHFSATTQEAEHIAQRLGLTQITQLEADILLIRKNHHEFSLTGQVQAVYWQNSALTLKNIEGQLDFAMQLSLSGKQPYDKKEKNKPAELVIRLDEPDYIEGDSISLAEYIVEELSLNLPLSPEYGANNQLEGDDGGGLADIAEK